MTYEETFDIVNHRWVIRFDGGPWQTLMTVAEAVRERDPAVLLFARRLTLRQQARVGSGQEKR